MALYQRATRAIKLLASEARVACSLQTKVSKLTHSDLDYLCFHVTLASQCLFEINETRRYGSNKPA